MGLTGERKKSVKNQIFLFVLRLKKGYKSYNIMRDGERVGKEGESNQSERSLNYGDMGRHFIT